MKQLITELSNKVVELMELGVDINIKIGYRCIVVYIWRQKEDGRPYYTTNGELEFLYRASVYMMNSLDSRTPKNEVKKVIDDLTGIMERIKEEGFTTCPYEMRED